MMKNNMKCVVKCPECGRVFNLLFRDDANEWYYGHDCEVSDADADDGVV